MMMISKMNDENDFLSLFHQYLRYRGRGCVVGRERWGRDDVIDTVVLEPLPA